MASGMNTTGMYKCVIVLGVARLKWRGYMTKPGALERLRKRFNADGVEHQGAMCDAILRCAEVLEEAADKLKDRISEGFCPADCYLALELSVKESVLREQAVRLRSVVEGDNA